MLQQRKLAAVIALGALFVSPFAWGCGGIGMQSCDMTDCAMTMEPVASDCHDSDAPAQEYATGCSVESDMWITCYEAPVAPEPARFDTSSVLDQGPHAPSPLATQVEIQPPAGPPESIAARISSRQHELGRFTFLSSFLL